MANGRTTFGVVAFIVLFLIGVKMAYTFMEDPIVPSVARTENFVASPTRISDCNCLPGNVPSKRKQMNMKFYVIPDRGGAGLAVDYSTKKSYKFYWYQCRSDFDWNKIKWEVGPGSLMDMYPPQGYIPCDLLNKFINGPTEEQFYFCQSLTDPGKTQSCY